MNGTKRVTRGRAGRLALVLQIWFSKRRAHRGQALVELAMILPIMLVLFSSALDLGRLYYSQITIDNAAKEGALEAARDTDNLFEFDSTRDCDAETNRVICLVVNEAKGSLITISPADVTLVCHPAGSPDPTPCPASPVIGETVGITVNSEFMLVSPILSVFFGGQAIPIASTSVAQIGVDPHPGYVLVSPSPAPTPAPTPTPTPTGTPDPDATPTPTPTPTPTCAKPTVSGPITISPGSGYSSGHHGGGTEFTMTAPIPVAQPAGCEFTYAWSFGDGLNGTGSPVKHTYEYDGTGPGNEFTVVLVIATVNSPTLALTQTVRVTP